MGKQAVQITHLNVPELIDTLNAALSEEWLAYYQYWLGARLMEGPMRSEIEPELLKHANEELEHAVKLVDRIIQLEGTPVLNPRNWFDLAKCAYESPEDPYVEIILDQNLRSERCAIQRYQNLADLTFGKDHATYEIAVYILDQELDHENDIEDWLTDIRRMKQVFAKVHEK